MYDENSIKLGLISQIDSFSKSAFSNIRSKTFFYDLFLDLYKYDNTYSLLYGDIDGLRKLNDEIGFKNADIAMEELLKIIQEHLPQNTIACRVGGDEFVFVIPDYTANEVRAITKEIHSVLSSTKQVEGLDITFGACDSTEFDTTRDMYKFAENKVTSKKHAHLKLNESADSIKDFDTKLDSFIDSTIKTYLSNFRFSCKRSFIGEDVKTLSYPILDTITTHLSNDTIESTNKDSDENEADLHKANLCFNTESVPKVYNLIMSNHISPNDLENIDIQDLEHIINCLTTDSVTGSHNNVFRDRYLLPHFQKNDSQFQIILAESLGIKILNSVLTHAGTDMKIKSTYNSICNELEKIFPKDGDVKYYIVHSGGGTFEIFIQGGINTMSYETVQNLFNKINSDENNVQLFGMIGNCPNVSFYNNVYTKLNKICEMKKNKIKDNSDYFITPDALKLLDISIESLVNYFKVQSKNLGIDNDQEKEKFFKKVIYSLINNFQELCINDMKKENKQKEERKKTMRHINKISSDITVPDDFEK